jgi:8-oxo-dGTP pyrophosphatase MutT (NUDIX family)
MNSGRPSIFVHLPSGWPAVNRAILRVAYLAARVLWRFTRPAHSGAVVALWRDGRVLLVHQTYRRRWSLPGGGVAPGEDPAKAARREIEEEIGIAPDALRPALIYPDQYESRREVVHIFEAELPPHGEPRPDGIEIDRAALLTPDEALDHDPPPHVRAYLLSRRSARKVASRP